MSATTAATAAAVIGAALYAGLQQGGILSPGGAPDHLPPADRSNSTSVQHLHDPAPLQPLVPGDSLHDALLTSADLAQDSNFSWDTEGLLIVSTMAEANRSSSLFVSTANPALSSVCLQLVMVRGGQQLTSAALART